MLRSKFWFSAIVAMIASIAVAIFVTRYNYPKIELPQRAYSETQNWSVLPETTTPPVWETGWKTDVFLVLEKNFLSGRTEEKFAARGEKTKSLTLAHANALAPFGTVYAPVLRKGHPEDVNAALQTYLTEHNKGRAFIIVADTMPETDLFDTIKIESAAERFGGYYATTPLSIGTAITCPDHMVSGCFDTIELKITDGSAALTNAEINSAFGLYERFQTYLKNEIGPMAEPLGDFEEVEIISTKRPKESYKDLP